MAPNYPNWQYDSGSSFENISVQELIPLTAVKLDPNTSHSLTHKLFPLMISLFLLIIYCLRFYLESYHYELYGGLRCGYCGGRNNERTKSTLPAFSGLSAHASALLTAESTLYLSTKFELDWFTNNGNLSSDRNHLKNTHYRNSI